MIEDVVPADAISMAEGVWYLKRSRLFEQLSDADLGTLEARSRIRTFVAREVIYSPADAANSVFLVVEGRVRIVSMTAEGKEAVLALIEPGELFGELALVSAGVREEHAEAAVPSLVAALPRQALEDLMGRDAALSLGIWKFIGWQRHRIERRLRSLLFRTTRERILFLLVDLVEHYGQAGPAGTVEIAVRMSHQELANLIGATRESATIALGELQDQGLVRLSRQRIAVMSVDRLRQLTGLPAPPATVRPASPAAPAFPVLKELT